MRDEARVEATESGTVVTRLTRKVMEMTTKLNALKMNKSRLTIQV